MVINMHRVTNVCAVILSLQLVAQGDELPDVHYALQVYVGNDDGTTIGDLRYAYGYYDPPCDETGNVNSLAIALPGTGAF